MPSTQYFFVVLHTRERLFWNYPTSFSVALSNAGVFCVQGSTIFMDKLRRFVERPRQFLWWALDFPDRV